MKKTIALILAFIMIMAVAPLNVFAVEPDKLVENIEITIDPKIAGKTPADCGEFLTVSGEGVVFDESTFKATYINGQHFHDVKEAEVFEEGTTYTSYIYIYPAEGYILPYYTDEINIKYNILRSSGKVEAGYYITAEGFYDNNLAEYYTILIKYTAEAQEPTGIARIPFLIGKFFDDVVTFITETFIQPIADLFMKLS